MAHDVDLPGLIDEFGQRHYFPERLQRQRQDRGRLFIASIANQLVGNIYVSLEKADEAELRKCLPAVPLLHHLEVRDGFRNRGIGTTLIVTAESFLRGLGHDQVALGVDMDNHDAVRFYRRLDYSEWSLSPIATFREHVDAQGNVSRQPEKCRIFVKKLPQIG